MPALLLDGSCHCAGRGRISERPRRFARENSRWRRTALHRSHRASRGMNLSAVLLAGGKSRRMGKDKATALFQGKPLWQVQLNLLRELRPAEIFLSARSDPGWRPADVTFAADKPPSRGPLSGVAASLGRIRTKHLITLAIDMPFMNEKYLCFLCDQTKPGRGVLPMIGGRAEP